MFTKIFVTTLAVLCATPAEAATGLMSINHSTRVTASGMKWGLLSAAHRSLPFGTKLKVSRGTRSVIVVVKDRGPFIRGRIVDVSPDAFRALGPTGAGVLPVKVEVVR